jgi:Tfp pilus assembly protein PilF
MLTGYALGVLLFTQAGVATTVNDQDRFTQTSEVAFEEISNGHGAEAVEAIERLLEDQPNDPSLLINLAAAQIQLGRYDEAAESYRRAMTSRERYALELADGNWIDSRLAARRGLQAVQGQVLAMR